MAGNLKATNSIKIHVPVAKAWQAITNPALIKQYMFGTDVISDWKPGNPITYKGEWEGKSYEDKGQIIEMFPFKHLHTTYWSSMSGKEDIPENYVNVYYDIAPEDGGSSVTITQEGITDEVALIKLNKNWRMVLEGMKKVLEG